jgi:hypothetical protein
MATDGLKEILGASLASINEEIILVTKVILHGIKI